MRGFEKSLNISHFEWPIYFIIGKSSPNSGAYSQSKRNSSNGGGASGNATANTLISTNVP